MEADRPVDILIVSDWEGSRGGDPRGTARRPRGKPPHAHVGVVSSVHGRRVSRRIAEATDGDVHRASDTTDLDLRPRQTVERLDAAACAALGAEAIDAGKTPPPTNARGLSRAVGAPASPRPWPWGRRSCSRWC